MAKQRLLPRLADAGDVVKLGMHRTLLSELPMIHNSEAMRLIPHARQQVSGRAGGFEDDRLVQSGQEYPFELFSRPLFPAPRLCQSDAIGPFDPEFFKHIERSIELPLSAVD